jgi:hypothetical protein
MRYVYFVQNPQCMIELRDNYFKFSKMQVKTVRLTKRSETMGKDSALGFWSTIQIAGLSRETCKAWYLDNNQYFGTECPDSRRVRGFSKRFRAPNAMTSYWCLKL